MNFLARLYRFFRPCLFQTHGSAFGVHLRNAGFVMPKPDPRPKSGTVPIPERLKVKRADPLPGRSNVRQIKAVK